MNHNTEDEYHSIIWTNDTMRITDVKYSPRIFLTLMNEVKHRTAKYITNSYIVYEYTPRMVPFELMLSGIFDYDLIITIDICITILKLDEAKLSTLDKIACVLMLQETEEFKEYSIGDTMANASTLEEVYGIMYKQEPDSQYIIEIRNLAHHMYRLRNTKNWMLIVYLVSRGTRNIEKVMKIISEASIDKSVGETDLYRQHYINDRVSNPQFSLIEYYLTRTPDEPSVSIREYIEYVTSKHVKITKSGLYVYDSSDIAKLISIGNYYATRNDLLTLVSIYINNIGYTVDQIPHIIPQIPILFYHFDDTRWLRSENILKNRTIAEDEFWMVSGIAVGMASYDVDASIGESKIFRDIVNLHDKQIYMFQYCHQIREISSNHKVSNAILTCLACYHLLEIVLFGFLGGNVLVSKSKKFTWNGTHDNRIRKLRLIFDAVHHTYSIVGMIPVFHRETDRLDEEDFGVISPDMMLGNIREYFMPGCINPTSVRNTVDLTLTAMGYNNRNIYDKYVESIINRLDLRQPSDPNDQPYELYTNLGNFTLIVFDQLYRAIRTSNIFINVGIGLIADVSDRRDGIDSGSYTRVYFTGEDAESEIIRKDILEEQPALLSSSSSSSTSL